MFAIGFVLVAALALPSALARAETSPGGFEWVQRFATAGDDAAGAVALDSLGNVYVGGIASGTLPGSVDAHAGAEDVFVASYTADGVRRWLRQLGSAERDGRNGMDIALDAFGHVVVTSNTYGRIAGAPEANAGGSDAFVASLDTAGNIRWIHQLGSALDEQSAGIATDADGNATFAGSTWGTLPGTSEPNAGRSDAFVASFDVDGNLRWVQQFGSARIDEVRGASSDPAGNVALAGYTDGTLPGSADANSLDGSADAFIASVDPTGELRWLRQLGDDRGNSDLAQAAATDAAGNIYATGPTDSLLPGASGADFGNQVFLAALDSAGEFRWIRQFGSNNTTGVVAVAIDDQQRAWVTGQTRGLPGLEPTIGTPHTFVGRFAVDGQLTLAQQFGQSNLDAGNGIAVGPGSTVFVAGVSLGPVDDSPVSAEQDEGFLAKLIPSLPTAAAVPAQPLEVVNTMGPQSGSVRVTWKRPPAKQRARLAGHVVTCRGVFGRKTIDVGRGHRATVRKLTRTSPYRCSVAAVNAVGRSRFATAPAATRPR